MLRQKGETCHYCGTRVFPPGSPEVLANKNVMATRDHVFPQIWRTATCDHVDQPGNTVIACALCNNVKGGYPHEPFMYFLRQHGGTRLFNPIEFKKFIFGLALAGFRAAMREAKRQQPKPQPELPPRGPQGRFTKRDLHSPNYVR